MQGPVQVVLKNTALNRTTCGIRDCLGRRINNSTCPTRQRAITGDVLITHLSATSDFFDDFTSAVLKKRNFELV